MRILPSFIVIGEQKSGTSSLFDYLSQHPEVVRPFKKEIYFFDWDAKPDIKKYKAYFPLKLTRWYFNRVLDKPLHSFEATPHYFFNPNVPARIQKHFPNIKVIVLLRNPTLRAYSGYQHIKRHKAIPAEMDFWDVVNEELARGKELESQVIDEKDEVNMDYYRYSILARGKYVTRLKRWLKYFSKEQILVLKSGDLFEEPEKHFAKVADFLDLSPDYDIQFEQINQNQYRPMDPKIREWLDNYFEPYNQELYDFLGAIWGGSSSYYLHIGNYTVLFPGNIALLNAHFHFGGQDIVNEVKETASASPESSSSVQSL